MKSHPLKYFHIGYCQNKMLISTDRVIQIIKENYWKEFDCLMMSDFLRVGRGEQVSRMLRELANKGILIQENILLGLRKDGRKKARYIYRLKEEMETK